MGQTARVGHRTAAEKLVPATVTELILRYGGTFFSARRSRENMQQPKVLADLTPFRMAQKGGRIHRCDVCGDETPLYNSCGDRHCPQCQARQRAAWLDARRRERLPVDYFHVVFTVPQELVRIAAARPAVFCNPLFRSCGKRCWRSPPRRGTSVRSAD